MPRPHSVSIAAALFLFAKIGIAQSPETEVQTQRLSDIRMRDACVLADEESGAYYIVASARPNAVRAYTSKDFINWEGPRLIWETPEGFWDGAEMRGIWAPELHKYREKYYLFLTFNTATELCEQWNDWLPRVRRGSQILVGDSPLGPFKPFSDAPTLPKDTMTLDGPYFHTSKSGKLFMIWSSFTDTGYAVGLAISDNGKVAGPWRHQEETIYADDGGHGMLFKRFDGQLMLTLHSPNRDTERIHFFEIEDTGETLRIVRPF